jgi:hypothetical protein
MHAEERFYESGRWLWWDHFRHDICYALRSISICMCASISEVKSSSLRLRPNMASVFRLLWSQNPRDGQRQPLPFVGLFD